MSNNSGFMKGSGGVLDYIVVAELEEFDVGVKAVFYSNGSENRTFVGMRVRLAPNNNNTSVSPINMMDKMVNLYPNIRWLSKSPKRLSLIGGAIVNLNEQDHKGLHKWFTDSNIAIELFIQLQKLFPNTEIMLSSIFVDYYTEQFLKKFTLPEIKQGNGDTVINMFNYKKDLFGSGSITNNEEDEEDE
ncbi:MAG: hypothetical protein KAH32_03045 [Chlamydiia bacterium]|nr:hypothetical protein [Chlamydiia bacterium]